ncbi:MAG: hypothetical protein EOP48_27740, partial [Sphingobacteriales bacterium]
MTKLTKLINSPENFIADAIKKRTQLLEYEVKLLNEVYRVFGSSKVKNLTDEKQKILQLWLQVYEKYRVKHHLISWLYLKQSLNTKDPLVVIMCALARLEGDKAVT